MTVADMIRKLSEFPQDLPIVVADWNEQYSNPSEAAAEIVAERNGQYYSKYLDDSALTSGKFVVIGDC